MKTSISCVTRSGVRSGVWPRVTLCGGWLADSGFVPGALTQFTPERKGLAFRLFDENINSYSSLFNETREAGGTLIRVSKSTDRGPVLSSYNSLIRNTGLFFGDSLIARYEYGFIRVRKLPCRTKFIPVQIFKDSVRLHGNWLGGTGFVPGMYVTAASEIPETLTLRFWDGGPGLFRNLAQYARKYNISILRVNAGPGYVRYLDIPCSRFEIAGLCPDTGFLAWYKYGIIKLRKPNWKELGF